MDFLPTFGALASALAGIIGALVAAQAQWRTRRREPEPGTSLEGRIETLSRSLKSAARDVDAIQNEIAARQQLVEKLREDAETYEQLVDLNRAQVEAIVSQLQHVVDTSSAQSNRWTTRMTLVSMGVGLVVAVGVGLLFWSLG